MRPGYSLSPLVLALSLALAPAAQASTTMEVTGADGSVWATLSIGDASDNAGLAADEAMRSITSAELQAVKDSIYYWSDVLGAGATVPVIEISPLVTVADNASAGSDLVGSSGETLLQAALLGHDTSRQEGADREPTTGIELYAAASIEREALTLNPLSRNGMSFHLTSIIVHEVMHALGMVADVSKETGTLSDEGSSLFASHLVDVYGTSASQGVTFQTVTEDELKNLDGIEHGTKSRDESVFYVLSDDKHGSEASGVKFAGTNVTEVIGATTAIYYADTDFLVQNEETGTWSVVDPTIANSVIGGIPVNGNEGGSVGLELSHLELQNSLMSHQSWRNWALPMEAELAVLQDLGYTIDRKRYFGTSIYSSGSYNDAAITISQAFWAREAGEWVTGVASTQTGAVGVHVYGSLNEVTIAADQLADGAESFGVRVDGQMNDITLDSGYTVSANGTNGTGIAFTYGNSHTLTLEAGSTVSAAGEGGKALVFDFGSNLLGNSDAYRGSYINASVSSGYWTNTARLGTLSAIDGALVETVNISGAVSAPSGTAIYISENALVSTINVKSGATISG
ncbi:MAG: hypothetical protein Q4F91_08725, partial [Sutterella sp.]|nr:hypothetical protein [Sutterella sp.]